MFGITTQISVNTLSICSYSYNLRELYKQCCRILSLVFKLAASAIISKQSHLINWKMIEMLIYTSINMGFSSLFDFYSF